jgi:hypothetical protein
VRHVTHGCFGIMPARVELARPVSAGEGLLRGSWILGGPWRFPSSTSSARLRLGLALVLGTTPFGSLWAMVDEGPKWAAVAVTIGLAISLTPILLRVLPPLARDAETNERDPDYAITVVGLVGYVAVVAGFLILLDIG